MNETNTPPVSTAFLVIGAAHEVEARFEAVLTGVGLSLAKFGVLAKLVEAREPIPLGSLAERCSCVRSNMTQLMDRLEAERLVARIADTNDRRCVRAALTPEGRKRHAEGARALEEAEREIFAGLDEQDRAALTRLAQAAQAAAV